MHAAQSTACIACIALGSLMGQVTVGPGASLLFITNVLDGQRPDAQSCIGVKSTLWYLENICTTLVGCMIHWGLYWPRTVKKVAQYSLSRIGVTSSLWSPLYVYVLGLKKSVLPTSISHSQMRQ
jgi:hypothetical protein